MRILLINDQPGYGKVALSSMMPILSYMDYEVMMLPTVLLSNTLDYGQFARLETTEYMKQCFEVWDKLGFDFDAICIGFIASEEQSVLLADFCEKRKKSHGTKIFVDPIMGDNGRLYNSMTAESVENRRRLCAVADVIVPNMTEATYLADYCTGETAVSQYQMQEILGRLRALGTGSIVITSAAVDGQTQVCGYDGVLDSPIEVHFSYVPIHLNSTGDIFSAILAGEVMKGCSLQESTEKAVKAVGVLIQKELQREKHYKGLVVEQYLEELEL